MYVYNIYKMIQKYWYNQTASDFAYKNFVENSEYSNSIWGSVSEKKQFKNFLNTFVFTLRFDLIIRNKYNSMI